MNETHVALVGAEVDVRDEEHRLRLHIVHHFEDGHIVTFL